MTAARDSAATAEFVRDTVAGLLRVPPERVADDRPFREIGLDSAQLLAMLDAVATWLGRAVPSWVVWQYPTVAALSAHLTGNRAQPVPHQTSTSDGEPIAIIGIGCRLPGGIDTPEALWAGLRDGIDAVREVPPDRWNAAAWHDPDPTSPGRMNTRWGGFLSDVTGFDADLFRISPAEARHMDPQQRIALEVAWAAVEDAGILPEDLAGSRTGVFLGVMAQEYHLATGAAATAIGTHSAVGWDNSIIPARIAYFLGLRGPVMAVATACSSSLSALHLAVQSLLRGESDAVLAGGVNLMLHPHTTVAMTKFGAMSPDGRCRAFDAGANGYVRGEGCGVAVLRRLADALVAGDRIYALIRGSAVNNDGASNGLTAPNPEAQVDVLRSAWRDAGIPPAEVSYVEAHGTGTPLGDPIEAAALGAAFGEGRESELLVGSVKTNFGHLEPAAGIAGVLKTALALYHGELPASLHFTEPNPHIDFEANRLRVVTSLRPWPNAPRRLAGVSSFGFGGTNAHVALAEAPHRRPAEPVVPQRDVRDPRPTLVFLFSGHGAQWRGMGRELLGEPVFRAELDECDRAIHAVTGWSVIEELAAHEGRLNRTEVIQPALFAMQVALARTVRRWGLIPDVVLGQSVGEVAAAVVAGALSLAEGARIITTWSALVAERASGRGTVIVCELPVAEAAALGDRASVAGHLSPGQVALSGTNDAIAAVERELTEAGVRVQRVDIDYPSHGPLMSALAPELSRRLGEVHRGTASVPFFSTVTGGFVDGAELDARYWVRNMCEPMLLAEAVQALGRQRLRVVEIGPHPVVRRSVERTLGYEVLFTCRRDRPAREGLEDLAGRLWSDGFDLDWAAVSGRPARTLRAPVCLAVSGKSAAARAENAARLADHLDGREDTEPAVLTDVAYTAATHRSHLEHRGVVVAESVAEAVGGLRALSQDRSAAGVVADAARAGERAELAVLFTGQGSQRPGMGLALCGAFEAFRREFDEVSAALDVHLRKPLREVISSSEVHETEFTQPALFALEVALYRLWRSWGIEPAVVAGHSIGELSAAYVAGVLNLRDAAQLVCARGRLMQRCQRGGAMISLEASESEVLAVLSEVDGQVSVAGLNGPHQTVVSGDEAAVTAVARAFAGTGRRTRRLDVSHAFHSAHMDAMLTDFAGVARGCRFHAPRLPMVSTMTGEWMGADLAPGQGVRSTRYWVRQAREAVRFLDAMHTLAGKGIRRYLECGPSAVLGAMAAGCVEDARFTASLTGDGDEVRALLTALGTLHVTGTPVDWRSVFAGTGATRTDLPTYAFQRQHYWLGEPVGDAAGVADWLYERTWQPLDTPSATILNGQWAVVVPEDATDTADAVVSALESAGAAVRVLAAADDRTGFANALSELDPEIRGVLTLTPLDETPTSPGASRGAARTLALIQALGDCGFDAPLWILTRGGTSRPAQALSTGLGLVAALEHPNRWGGVIDLPETLDPATTRQLLATVARDDPGEHVELRPEGRAARRLRRAGRGASAPAWRGRGTALITGGSGALAAHLARWLANRGVEHVVLASRRGAEVALPEELAEVRVTRVACDVSDRDQLERVLARLDDDPAPLRSVFHAAGVLDDKLLARMDAASLSTVAAPKTGGAWHLHELTQRHDLDAFVLFSSTAGTLGQVGQANYAMANAGLDALAELRRASGLPAISIGWGPWATGGMASGAAGDALRDTGLIPMPPEAALSGLDIALETGRSLVIAHIDWSTVEDRPLLREIVAGQVHEDRGGSLRAALHTLPERERRARLLELLAGEAAAVLGVEQAGSLDPRRGFSDLGFDSMMAIELSRRVGLRTGVATTKTLVFDHPNLEAASAWLLGELSERLAATPEPAAAGRVDEPLAIVGVGLRMPGNAHDLDSLWEVLAEGRDTLAAIPAGRFDVESIYHPDPDASGRTYVRHAALLDDVATFDAEFFGISPREAEPMDPQHRLLLEAAWNSLEDAGIRPGELRDSATGVFIGAGPGEYGKYRSGANQDTYQLTGSLPSFNAGRLAYHLGLQGPALSVDTACSSALVALHLASEALRNRECDLALAGGVQVLADPGAFIALCRTHALSPDGRSKTFSSAADGYGRGEGVGVVAVMRLSDALAANRPVYGVIRGTAINHDGASSGITAPNGSAQQKVIRAALRSAGLSTSDIDYVECHGTGTSLGDPIEVQALAAVYGQDRDPQRPIGIGTVKSVIGHLESAAGIAGVCKVLASFRHDALPATMHSTPRNPNIEWDELAVRVVDMLKPWPRRAEGSRRAGVSSFGLSGTNAHVVLEEPPVSRSTVDAVGPVLVSGRDERALREQAGRWADWLAEHPDVRRGDVIWTASGRTHFDCRASVQADNPADGLRAVAEGRSHPAVVRGVAGRHGNVVFVYPGQGSQWEGMGKALLAESAVFAAAVSACDAALRPWTGWSVRDALAGEVPLDRVDVVQPALFAMGIGLTAVWRSLGVEPAAVVGHSQGEVVAAVVSGALTLAQGAKVVALRSQAVSRVSGRGGMALVERPLAEVTELIAPYGPALSIAAVNTATSTVVSGEADAIDGLVAELQAKDVYCRKVKVDYASHNAQMDELLPGLAEAFGDLVPGETTIPFYSTVDAGAELDGAYWCRNLRETVRFDLALRRLQEDGHGVFVEVSAHPVLAMPLTDGTDGTGGLVVGTLARQHGDRGQLLRSLSQLHVQGYEIDWAHVLDTSAVVGLPTYAFQRERFWLPVTRPSGPPGTHPWLSAVTELANGDGFLFTGHLSPADHPWLADHSVFGSALVPGTGLLELALAAAREVGAAGVAQLTLTEPLLLTEPVSLQVIVGADRSIAIHSRTDGGQWQRHASGVLREDSISDAFPDLDPVGERVELDYPQGLDYGPAFRGLTALWRYGDTAYGVVRLPERLSAAGYLVHPALLDAALHTVITREVLLPFEWTDVEVYATGSTELRVRVDFTGTNQVTAWITDDAGHPVARIGGLLLRPPAAEHHLYRVELQPVAVPAEGMDNPDRVVIDVTGTVREVTVQALETLRQPSDAALVWVIRELVHAPLRGLLRVARNEYPERSIRLIDVGPLGADPPVFERALAVPDEPELVVRDGAVLAPRLVRVTDDPGESRPLDPNGTVLITGGTGELGRLIAAHVVQRYGVRHLVLASRHPEEITVDGADVRVVACDVTSREDLARVLSTMEHPLTAVFHLAGVLDDGLLADLTPERFERVMAPKVDGALHLHELTKDLDLAAFVLFSSAAGILGSPGQANYAAANTFLDALVAHEGRATSIAWGLWQPAGIGMTSHLGEAELDRMRRQRMSPMPVDEALRLLDRALGRPPDCVVAVRLDLRQVPGELPPMLRALVRPAPSRAVPPGLLRDQLLAMSEPRRRELLTGIVLREAAVVLGVGEVKALSPQQVLKELGLDSLMAVELRRRLAEQTGATLPATLAFDYPTPTEIVGLLMERLELAASAQGDPRLADRLVERSVEDINAELDAFLETSGAEGRS